MNIIILSNSALLAACSSSSSSSIASEVNVYAELRVNKVVDNQQSCHLFHEDVRSESAHRTGVSFLQSFLAPGQVTKEVVATAVSAAKVSHSCTIADASPHTLQSENSAKLQFPAFPKVIANSDLNVKAASEIGTAVAWFKLKPEFADDHDENLSFVVRSKK